MKHIFLILNFLLAFMIGCSRDDISLNPDIKTTSTISTAILPSSVPALPTLTLVPSFTETPLPIPTQTPSPSPIFISFTTPSATPTVTVISQFTANISVSSVNVRQGPAETFPVLAKLVQGISLNILGRNADSSWIYVDLTLGQAGWVIKDSLEINFDLETLEIIEAPPFPTFTPTPLAIPQIVAWQNENKLVIQYMDFQPGELIDTDLILASSNKVFFTFGNQKYVDERNLILNWNIEANYFPTNELILIVAKGDQGSVAQTTIVLEGK